MSSAPSNDPFDEKAATWDTDPAKVERATTVAECITATVPTDSSADAGVRRRNWPGHPGDAGRRGPRHPGRHLQRDARRHPGQDRRGAIIDARVWALDLATEPPPDEQFDLIVTVLTLHHITDLASVLAGFARLLQPGGHLCIVDLDHEDGSFHGDGFAGHRGFKRPALAASIATHGFADISFMDCHHLIRDGATYPLFLATARREPRELPVTNGRR